MLNIDAITRQVLHNCDISDANNAGMYSICGLALRLRDLVQMGTGIVRPGKKGTRPRSWNGLKPKKINGTSALITSLRKLSINGTTFDPFDTIGINAVLEPQNFFYGAGFARSLKPTFFLAAIEEKSKINGTTVYTLDRELARDLLTIPALSQDD